MYLHCLTQGIKWLRDTTEAGYLLGLRTCIRVASDSLEAIDPRTGKKQRTSRSTTPGRCFDLSSARRPCLLASPERQSVHHGARYRCSHGHCNWSMRRTQHRKMCINAATALRRAYVMSGLAQADSLARYRTRCQAADSYARNGV